MVRKILAAIFAASLLIVPQVVEAVCSDCVSDGAGGSRCTFNAPIATGYLHCITVLQGGRNHCQMEYQKCADAVIGDKRDNSKLAQCSVSNSGAQST